MSQIVNPYTDEPLSDADAEYVAKVRVARINARKAARSGNPARRAEALGVVAAAPRLIRAVFAKDAREAALR